MEDTEEERKTQKGLKGQLSVCFSKEGNEVIKRHKCICQQWDCSHKAFCR